MSSFHFRCRCKAELDVDGSAQDAIAMFESWQTAHLHGIGDPVEKTQLALQAKELHESGHSLREIGETLGIGHPQSVKFLMERYAGLEALSNAGGPK